DPNVGSNANDKDCDGVPTSEDCDDNDPNVGSNANDKDCDGVPTSEDCDDNDPNVGSNANDKDCDGVPTSEDCDDNDPNVGSNANDKDCDGVPTSEDCDDNDPNVGSNANDKDCDGVPTSEDCDDNDANVGSNANDKDCDGVPTSEDCDDNDPNVGSNANDKDCDGVPTSEDCDDNDPNVGSNANDKDCDGIPTSEDCDDNDANVGSNANDKDCDGVPTSEDCDDNDPNVGSNANDKDCDGVPTSEDCDDNDANVGSNANDKDCDGVPTSEDCDDNDPNVGSNANDKDCDGVPTSEDCDDNDPNVGSNANDKDCDGVPTSEDCDDNDPNVGSNANDKDCDGVPTSEDCDDNDANVGSNVNDKDCDGIPTSEDCDDNDANVGSNANDKDCDGVPTSEDCDDNDPNVGSNANDKDCDGVPTSEDCDDNDPNVGSNANDKDCDGVPTSEDCDDNDPNVGSNANDKDCDGVPTSEDCDDNDANVGSNANDKDCDGVPTSEDCDDNDPNVGSNANDKDCDGVPTSEDCDDNDANVGSNANDKDCDGVPTTEDCDDNDPNVGSNANDKDCDGVPTSEDCDDNDPNITTSNQNDSDNDTVNDCEDVCPGSDDRVDTDGDGIPDGCDQCVGGIIDRECNVVDSNFCTANNQPYNNFYWFENNQQFFKSDATHKTTFTEYSDNTALLRGQTQINGCVVEVYVVLKDKKNWSDWSASGGSFKEEGCSQAVAQDLSYYVIDGDKSFAKAVGGSCVGEGVFKIMQRPDPNDPNTPNYGFHVGPGGALFDSDIGAEGAAGWGWMGTTEEPKKWTIDFNFLLDCGEVTDCVLENPTLLSCDIGNIINSSCDNAQDGSATVTAVNGKAPFSYEWSNGETTATATSLGIAENTVIITDANGAKALCSVIITASSNDSDNDGVNDCEDVCPGSDDRVDTDGDGIPDGCDQCVGGIMDRECNVVDSNFCTANNQPYNNFYWFENNQQFFKSDATHKTTFTEYSDNTALLRGQTQINGCVVEVYVVLKDKKNWSDWSASGGSFKEEGCSRAVAQDLSYYVIDGDKSFAKAVGGSCVGEGVFKIMQRPDPNDPNTPNYGFHVGPGGALFDSDIGAEGAAGWGWMGTTEEPKKWTIDFNFLLDCGEVTDCIFENPTLLSCMISAQSIKNTSCLSANDGSATVAAISGKAPYTYEWSNGETTAIATSLGVGENTVIVTDANGAKAFCSIIVEANTNDLDCDGVTADVDCDDNDPDNTVSKLDDPSCDGSLGVDDYTNNIGEFIVYPVPFKEHINLKYTINYNTDIKIQIFDVRGALINSYEKKNYTRGVEEIIEINLSHIEVSMLFVNLITDKETLTRRIVARK
ncbi:T9SS type A sorting domain-containing protein, partial [Algibacter sp. 2305UL17-15]|uniref:T9SS type A sorting domain-containing protein n=1 Tax=Algibacter sp. 2305UL17-15 TaxID=3231268 RepID=UPI00345A539B